MKSVKSFIKKFTRSDISIILRNNFHIKEVNMNFKDYKCLSVSDCFL